MAKSTIINTDEYYLKQTFLLARKGVGWTFPNPMVGCIIVKNGRVIAKGYHHEAGGAHAEIDALHSAKESVAGAVLYVNLEPCSHYGKTPPCVKAIIESGIIQVVCPMADINPKIAGKGIKELRSAGIKVVTGLMHNEARGLNETYFTYYEKKRPFVALKFASSLDGKIATSTGDSKWITNIDARTYARSLRKEFQSILVGINTVLKDDPDLDVRKKNAKDPVRIILDSSLKIPLTSSVLHDSRVLIATTTKANQSKKELLQKRGIEVISCGDEKVKLKVLMEELYKREIISIFVEGGSQTMGSFIDAKLVDKVYAFYAPLIIGGKDALTPVGGEGVSTISQAVKLNNITFRKFDDCFMLEGYKDSA